MTLLYSTKWYLVIFVTIYKKSSQQVKLDNWTTFYESYEADYEAE